MILLADAGNSRIKWAIWDAGDFRQRGQASHGEEGWTALVESNGVICRDQCG